MADAAAAAVNLELQRVVGLFKGLMKYKGSAGRVNQPMVTHLEAEIDLTLDQLQDLIGQLGVIVNPIPFNLGSYRSPDYMVRRKVIREQKVFWKTLLDDVTQPWNH